MNTQLKPASSAIVIDGDRYLLIRRANPPAQDLYAFPGGRAEPGETPAETALRELEEETGLKAENPRLFATYELAGTHGGGYFLSVFLVDCLDVREVTALDDALEAGLVRGLRDRNDRRARERGRLHRPPGSVALGRNAAPDLTCIGS